MTDFKGGKGMNGTQEPETFFDADNIVEEEELC